MLGTVSRREKNLEARAKELRARELRAKGQAKEEGAEAAVPWEERRKEVEAEFWRLTGLTGPEGVTGEGIEPSEKSSETAEQRRRAGNGFRGFMGDRDRRGRAERPLPSRPISHARRRSCGS